MTKKTTAKTLAVACFQQEGKTNPEHGCTLDIMALSVTSEAVLRVIYRFWAWDWKTVNYMYSGSTESLAGWVTELEEFDAESAFSCVSIIERMEREHVIRYESVFWLNPNTLPELIGN